MAEVDLKTVSLIEKIKNKEGPFPHFIVTNSQHYTDIANRIMFYGSGIEDFADLSRGVLPGEMANYISELFDSRDATFEKLLTQSYPIGGTNGGN